MEGCLTTLVKLIILAGLFGFGLVMGYLYYQGIFDAGLVEYTFRNARSPAPEEAARRVDERASVEAAFADLAKVERRFVLWRGLYSDTRLISTTLAMLTVRGETEPRRTFIVFVNRPIAELNIHVGDTIEVLGQLRKFWVATEDREGRSFPQVLAVAVKKITPQVDAAPPGPPPVTRVTKELGDKRP